MIRKASAQKNFEKLDNWLKGCVVDDIRQDAVKLVAYPVTKYTIDSILVKLLPKNADKIDDFVNVKGFLVTLRVFENTTFNEIKTAASIFWNLIEQKYELTDEYFCNLQIYQNSV